MKKLFLLITFCIPLLGVPLEKNIEKSIHIVEMFASHSEKNIPPKVIRNARGLAIVSLLKGGFFFSAKGGTGFVMVKNNTPHHWSAPCAIWLGGLGVGPQIGACTGDYIFVLNDEKAVKAFTHPGNILLGGSLSFAAGPIGRAVEGDVLPIAAVYAYCKTQGGFVGASLEGSIMAVRNRANEVFYHKKLSIDQILYEETPPPEMEPLIEMLNSYLDSTSCTASPF